MMGTPRHAAYYSNGKCKPGSPVEPMRCNFHPEHHWCDVCEGFYGIPHDRIHEGRDAHPLRDPRDCACRPCRDLTAARRASVRT